MSVGGRAELTIRTSHVTRASVEFVNVANICRLARSSVVISGVVVETRAGALSSVNARSTRVSSQ